MSAELPAHLASPPSQVLSSGYAPFVEGAQQPVDKAIGVKSIEPTPKGALIGGLLAVAFGAVCGAAIGFGLVDIGCHGKCGAPRAIGTLLGAAFGALGVSIVAVLVMRALVEWRRHNADLSRRTTDA